MHVTTLAECYGKGLDEIAVADADVDADGGAGGAAATCCLCVGWRMTDLLTERPKWIVRVGRTPVPAPFGRKNRLPCDRSERLSGSS